jgi:hypothetical protein
VAVAVAAAPWVAAAAAAAAAAAFTAKWANSERGNGANSPSVWIADFLVFPE